MKLITERANPMFPDIAWAEFSEDKLYRYRLSRKLDGNGKGKIVWCMLNPSTADAFKLDPTLRRCKTFSELWGFDQMMIVNMFAYRSPNPKDLYKVNNPIGPENFDTLKYEFTEADMIVCGWGSEKITKQSLSSAFKKCFRPKLQYYCLGHNTDGSPKHPLYLRKTAHLTKHII